MSRIERWLRRIVREEIEADYERREREQQRILAGAFNKIMRTSDGQITEIRSEGKYKQPGEQG